MSETVHKTSLEGVIKISRPTFADDRGFFRETFRKNELEQIIGYNFEPVQANHSRSAKDTLRGIHIAPWHKLITVLRGQVQQVVVDCRPDSPTFGQYESFILGEDNWHSVFVPKNCGNSFLVLTDTADYSYLATQYWEPGLEKNVKYNDQTLGIDWMSNSPVLSEKDHSNPSFKELFPDA